MDRRKRPANLHVTQGGMPALIGLGRRIYPRPYGLNDEDIAQVRDHRFSTRPQLPGFYPVFKVLTPGRRGGFTEPKDEFALIDAIEEFAECRWRCFEPGNSIGR